MQYADVWVAEIWNVGHGTGTRDSRLAGPFKPALGNNAVYAISITSGVPGPLGRRARSELLAEQSRLPQGTPETETGASRFLDVWRSTPDARRQTPDARRRRSDAADAQHSNRCSNTSNSNQQPAC
jgi:hypothetical protein